MIHSTYWRDHALYSELWRVGSTVELLIGSVGLRHGRWYGRALIGGVWVEAGLSPGCTMAKRRVRALLRKAVA